MNHKTATTPSVTKGQACQICGVEEPCIHKFTMKSGVNTVQYPTLFSRTASEPLSLSVIDSGLGAKVTLETISKCSNQPAICPTTVLHTKNRKNIRSAKEILVGTNSKEITVHFKEPQDKSEFEGITGSLQYYLTSFIDSVSLPDMLLSQPRRYIVEAKGCETSHHGLIDVYPSVSFLASVGFIYDFSVKHHTDQERRQTQVENKKAAYKALDQVLPKDKNKLRNGWKKDTSAFSFLGEKSVNVGVMLEIRETKYSAELLNLWTQKKKSSGDSLSALKRWEKLFGYAKEYLLPSPDSKGKTRTYKVADFDVKPASLGLAYGYERTVKNAKMVGQHFGGLYADPLFDFEFKIDLLQLIAAYCKVGDIVAKAREQLAKQEKKGNGFSVGCYLAFSATVSVKVGMSLIDNQWGFQYGTGNKLELSLKGVVNFTFKTTVLFVEASLKAGAEIATSGGFELEQHEKGLDLVGYHDGIRAYVALAAEAEIEVLGRKKKTQFESKNEFIIAAPLKTADSSFRINLMGEQKSVLPPKVEQGERQEFYKWYADHWGAVGRQD